MQIETLETRQMMSTTVPAVAPAPVEPAILVDLNDASQKTAAQSNDKLTGEQKRVVELLTRTFENSSLEARYDYSEDIEDGRGITAGRAGFCSGTTDMYEVVARYTQSKPNNVLAKYLPRLTQLRDAALAGWSDSDSEAHALGYANRAAAEEAAAQTWGLEGLADEYTESGVLVRHGNWHAAAQDAAFCDVQDQVNDELYYQPAMAKAKTLGLKTAIAKGQLYDAIIQHGDGSDHDGLSAMIQRANSRSNGSPGTGVNETVWLTNFLQVRHETLSNASDEATAEGWADSVSRVEVYQTLLRQGNTGLTGTLHITVYGDDFTITPSNATPAPTPTPIPTPTPTPTPTPAARGTITGRVFNDGEQDGVENNDDFGCAGRRVFIDLDNDHYLDTNEVRTTTDANGNYRFNNVTAGRQNVCLESVDWMFCTTPISQSVNVVGGPTASHIDFGEF